MNNKDKEHNDNMEQLSKSEFVGNIKNDADIKTEVSQLYISPTAGSLSQHDLPIHHIPSSEQPHVNMITFSDRKFKPDAHDDVKEEKKTFSSGCHPVPTLCVQNRHITSTTTNNIDSCMTSDCQCPSSTLKLKEIGHPENWIKKEQIETNHSAPSEDTYILFKKSLGDHPVKGAAVLKDDGTDTSILCQRCNLDFSSAVFLESHSRLCDAEYHQRFIHDGDKEASSKLTERDAMSVEHFDCDEALSGKANNDGLSMNHQELKTNASSVCNRSLLHSLENPDETNSRGGVSFKTNSFSNTREQNHTKIKRFKCEECAMAFNRRGKLQSHMRTHTGEKPFICSECGKVYSCSSSIRLHMRTHTGEKPYKCGDCGKTFMSKKSIDAHMVIHSKEKPFMCKECGKKFSFSSSLRKHMRSHTDQKPFGCKECGKWFNQSSHLYMHMLIHTGEKPYECSKCNMCFYHTSHLSRHMRVHDGVRPFKCKECRKRFADNDSLLKHMSLHEGDRLKCNFCGKSFSNNHNLSRHRRTHTGEKPFKCNECGKCFNNQSNCSTHMKLHEGEKTC